MASVEIEEVEKKELIAETRKGGTQLYRAIYKGEEYVLKAILRSSIETQDELQHLMNEKTALKELNHPGINHLNATCKDDLYLYLLIEIVYGLPVHKLLQMSTKISEKLSKLIISQILLELQYMHQEGWVYRDLKASNIIINTKGKVFLIDLGFAKKIEKERTHSFCGTTHMMAPEFFENLEKTGYTYSTDYYALGILLYELISGKPPFGYQNDNLESNILKGIDESHFKEFNDQNLINFLKSLLEKDPTKRLGCQDGFNEIIKHEYLKDIDFDLINDILNEKQVSKDKLEQFDFSKYVDDIEDFGLKTLTEQEKSNKNEEIKEDDPFANF